MVFVAGVYRNPSSQIDTPFFATRRISSIVAWTIADSFAMRPDPIELQTRTIPRRLRSRAVATRSAFRSSWHRRDHLDEKSKSVAGHPAVIQANSRPTESRKTLNLLVGPLGIEPRTP